jgi:hypothetical protein
MTCFSSHRNYDQGNKTKEIKTKEFKTKEIKTKGIALILLHRFRMRCSSAIPVLIKLSRVSSKFFQAAQQLWLQALL